MRFLLVPFQIYATREKLKKLVTQKENKRISSQKAEKYAAYVPTSLLETIQTIYGNIRLKQVPCCVFSETEIDFHNVRNLEKGTGETCNIF